MLKKTIHYLTLRLFFILTLAQGYVSLCSAQSRSEMSVDWPVFLAEQDLVWAESLPDAWGNSVFIGNGDLGATIYLREGRFAWTINQTSVYYKNSRYPIGRMELVTEGEIEGGSARIDLWNAESHGTVKTSQGEVKWKSFCASDPSVLVVELTGAEGEGACRLEWIPDEALPPRPVYRKEAITTTHQHPAIELEQTAEGIRSLQVFRDGTAHAEHIREVAVDASSRVYYISIGYAKGAEQARAQAFERTNRAAQVGVAAVREQHQAWWHAYYPKSFLSVPDATLQAFYWIQMYKLGAGMREGGPVLDLMGPWFDRTPWPAIWWNLNVQLTYAPLFTANRLKLSESLFANLDRNRENLLNNVAPSLRGKAAAIGTASGQDLIGVDDVFRRLKSETRGPEMGNLPWVMYLYWLNYRYTMDAGMLRDRIFPLLKPTINRYLAIVEKGADGLWHLPPTFSPELATVADGNFDLALLRWGLQTLIESCEILEMDDPQLSHWREVLANLAPASIDEATGLMIGKDYPLETLHRHYSHLASIYPLMQLTPEDASDRELIEKSIKNWIERGTKYTGYSYTGAASMYALLGDGNRALSYFEPVLERYVLPNSFYREAGPCIETPLSAATSLQEMLLQSWGGVLRVFPAIPDPWQSVSFDQLRGEGAFLVSAVREQGQTQWVRIESLAGEPCVFTVADWEQVVVRAASGTKPAVRELAAGQFSVALKQGDWVILAANAASQLLPVQATVPSGNPFPL